MLLADIALVNKVDVALRAGVEQVLANIATFAPRAAVVLAESPVTVSEPERIRGARVLVVEDGPTLTHGGMREGAGAVAARTFGAAELVDPRPYAVGSIAAALKDYPHIGPGCRPWATGRRRSPSSGRPSTPRRPTWCSSPRPSSCRSS
jgi:predicted GTPase